jgi:hypothetical protein
MRDAAVRTARRSNGVGVVVTLLFIYAAWLGLLGLLKSSAQLGIVTAVLVAAATGLLRRQPWAAWLAMFCAGVALVMWILISVTLIRSGDFGPGLLIATAVWMPTWSLVAVRAWRRRSGRQTESVDIEVFT